MTIAVNSPAFENAQRIPTQYTGDGDNIAPPLEWDTPPAGTASIAVIMEDPDAPTGTFRHWGMYDLAPERTRLPEGTTQGAKTERFGYVYNDFGNPRYDGPLPPEGHGVHHYHFKVLALDVPHLNLPEKPSVDDLWKAVEGHVIDQGELVALYER